MSSVKVKKQLILLGKPSSMTDLYRVGAAHHSANEPK